MTDFTLIKSKYSESQRKIKLQVLEKPKLPSEEHIVADNTSDYKDLNKKYSKNRRKKFCKKCDSKSESSLSQIPIRLDSVVVTKILVLQKKISNTLYEISYELDQIPLPDGENDLRKRQKRSTELSTRLARNYLYDLERCSLEIDKQIKLIFGEHCTVTDRRTLILGFTSPGAQVVKRSSATVARLDSLF